VSIQHIEQIIKLSKYSTSKLKRLNQEYDRLYTGPELTKPELIYQLTFIMDAPYKNNWTPTKDELPHRNSWLLVCFTSAGDNIIATGVDIAYYDGKRWEIGNRESCIEGNVTHWMELPELPKSIMYL
jgi:hypothetical protein